MRMVRARLTCGGVGADAPAAGAGLIEDLLWAHAVPADGLEHLRVRSLPHGMDVVLFLGAPSDAAALLAAAGLLDRLRLPLARHGLSGVVV
ncbi:hypothetical protein HHL19_26980 [Streptomyces sp. R302]|uniref:hypothetical protein n=1 Tax=unclassified Streptomyces TaxID=2593676 RepID=UPI00145DEDB0|nr:MULTISPECIES: hypothetical protein [unclassified Streptomyces]NML52336.1 hypothetical protein [Streptomyces sp. R301]NML82198.1 hypothetical protein [Streptomyces sp. R302]